MPVNQRQSFACIFIDTINSVTLNTLKYYRSISNSQAFRSISSAILATWPVCSGIGGRHQSEWVAGLRRKNHLTTTTLVGDCSRDLNCLT